EALARDGGDVHDHAAAPGDHLAGHALQAEEHALGVDAHDAVPVRLREVHDVRAPGDPGVVHEDVDAAESRHHVLDHLVDAPEISHVRVEAEAPSSHRRHRIGGPLAGARVAIHGGDV